MPDFKHPGSLTVVIPALNEEANIRDAVLGAKALADAYFADWEILIFDDGSRDRTGEIADQLARGDKKIRVVHHLTPRNVGACYREAVQLATKDYLVLIPGDNENDADGMAKILAMAGSADVILPYPTNTHVRPWHRRLISKAFVALINRITGNNVTYYNGTVLHKTHVLKKFPVETNGFGYQADLILRVLAAGHSYREVGITISHDPGRKSKAFRVKNIVDVLTFLQRLAASEAA